MIRIAPVVVVSVLMAGHMDLAWAQPPKSERVQWEHFDIWLTAIEQHVPGTNDAAVRAMRDLKSSELEALFPYMVFTLRGVFSVKEYRRQFDELFARYGSRGQAPADQVRLKQSVERLLAADIDRFLKRAALLHADIALLFPGSHFSSSAGTGHVVADGRGFGDEGRTWHWMLGRAFLHVLPHPEDDDHVRIWYQAVGNHLWSTRNYTEAQPHIRRALALFPNDAEIQFLRGLIHESLGAPTLQIAVQAQVAEMRARRDTLMTYKPAVRSADTENAEALEAFQKALEADPDHHEARIRLARLLSLATKHERAASELRVASAKTGDPALLYFAQLFLGRAEESRDRIAEARRAYEAAAALYPKAQSPRLSLSQLALQSGERGGFDELFAVVSAPYDRDADPWWSYHAVRVPGSKVWVSRMRDAFRDVK